MDNSFHPLILISLLGCFAVNILLVIFFNRYKIFSYLKSFKISFTIGLIFLLFCSSYYYFSLFFVIANVLIYLLFSFCYVTLINTPESSIRYKIIELIFINGNNKVNKFKIFDEYNDIKLLDTRLERLKLSKTISNNSDFFIIKNKKIYIIFFFFYFLKRIYKIKK